MTSPMIPIMKPWLGAEEAAAATQTIESGWIAQGPAVRRFEEEFATAVGAEHAVAVSSATTGLHLALVVLGVGAGDDVIVPSLSFIATANAPRYVGAIPVFADVDPRTQNLTAATIEAVLTPRTRAVILVHQAGMPADIDEIHAFCDPRGIAVIEDAACAIGSTYHGRTIGGHSDVVVFSFHPRKIVTTGEGGMLTFRDAEIAARARRLREHGMSVSAADRHQGQGNLTIEAYLETGFNYRMTDVQAAIGSVQLGKLAEMIRRRRELAERYRVGLASIPGLQLPVDPPWGETNHQSYWVVLPDDAGVERNELMAELLEAGISTRRGIMAAHLEPAFAGHEHAPLPVTEHLTQRSIILPLFHQMTEAEQDRVTAAFTSCLERASEESRVR
jgi:perosamine synthetase